MTDNKKFWKTIKPCFSDKSNNPERIVIKDNDEIVMEDGKVAPTLNTFFSNIVTSLNISWYTTLSIANVGKMEEGFR